MQVGLVKKYSNKMANIQDLNIHNTVHFYNPTSLWTLLHTHNLCGPSKCQSSHIICYLHSEYCYGIVA